MAINWRHPRGTPDTFCVPLRPSRWSQQSSILSLPSHLLFWSLNLFLFHSDFVSPFYLFCLSIIASKWHYRNLTIALTCVKKHHELFYVFWHGRNGHLYCKGQQTSEPSVLKKNSINKYSRKGQNFSLVFGNLHLLGMQLLIILLQTKNLWPPQFKSQILFKVTW